MELVVARAGRAHGLRGEVGVEVRTDAPERRFAPGAVLRTDPDVGALTVVSARDHSGRLLVRFAEVDDRDRAEELRGVLLLVDVDPAEDVEPDAWHTAELVGLRAVTTDGTDVGEVVGLEHLPAQDALVVRQRSGATVLVPFVTQIVPEVDVAGGRVVLDPPGGLLEDPDDAAGSPEPSARSAQGGPSPDGDR